MKFSRFVALCSVASALPTLAFAAQLSVTGLTGQARAIVNGETVVLKSGSVIEPGSGIETNTGSSAELTLPGGAKLVLAPGTRLRVKSCESTPGLLSCETVLLRGKITGDATGTSAASNVTIRTTAGVANVAGASFGIGFAPASLTTGAMTVVSSQGTVSVLSVNSTGTVSVPAGSELEVGSTGGNSSVTAASAETLAAMKSMLAGNVAGKSDDAAEGQVSTSASPASASFGLSVAASKVPNLAAIPINGKLTTISPNGEGSSGL
jgi:ferric-dicitrate binding protein FerR (iron transport regulator)